MPCVRPLADIVDPCMPWESLRTRLWPLHGAASRSEVGVQWEKMNSNTAERSSLAGAAVWNAMEGCRPQGGGELMCSASFLTPPTHKMFSFHYFSN